MNRFEQLIEYVINDEEHKAQELFHDIIVEKSRQIYENMMAEEDLEEGAPSMDAQDNLIDEVEMEEESDMHMEADEEDDGDDMDGGDDMGGSDMGDDMSGGDMDDPATKGDIMDLEDKLDQLMAEFEDLMGDSDMGDGDGFGPDDGGDAIEMDDTSDMMGADDQMGMMEAVTLKAAPKPVTSEEGGVNKKSTVAANAGAKGPIGNSVKPVHAGGEMGGNHDTPAYRNTTKDMIGRVGNTPSQSTQNLKPANKPHLGQASGVNTRSPVARG
jgi:hypothetical protein